MSIQKQAGVALIGVGSGQALIPAETELTRLHFYDGKFLRGPDLTLEQEYLLTQVRLANQAGGSGIVHGLTCAVRDGRLQIGAGLAMDPRGRALLLPEAADLALAPLIAAASTAGLTVQAAQGGFADCLDNALDEDAPSTAADGLYLLVALHTEAFCGSEEVYGRLCETACVSDSERPYIREGIVVQALPLNLDLPLFGIALGLQHERSRVASAYFRRGDAIWPTLIGGGSCSLAQERARNAAGDLLSDLWCQGAMLAGGEAVPLAVLSYHSGTLRFIDNWIARRERMQAPARGYWAGRMGMRPWPAFLAEMLQFQCQLPGALSAGGSDSSGEDPCAPDRAVVHNAAELVNSLQRLGTQLPDAAPEMLARLAVDAGALLPSLRALAVAPSSDRVLIDGGIIELPSAGWLPVDPASSETSNDQVRRLVGAGLDLRFCVVRPDYVQHALEEAQHMARISLLAGLDDPSARPEVDILVPNGRIEERVQEVPGSGYATTMDVIEDDRRDTEVTVEAADNVATARPASSDAVAIPRILAAERIGRAREAFVAAEAAVPAAAVAIPPVIVANPDDDEEIDLSGAAREALADDGSYGLSLAGRTPTAFGGFGPGSFTRRTAAMRRTAVAAAAADDSIEDRSIWLDFHTERDPFTVTDGTRLRVDLRLVWLQVTGRPVNDPVMLSDVRLFGFLQRQRRLQTGGRESLIGRLEVDGSIAEPDEPQPTEAVRFSGRLRIDRDTAPRQLTLSFTIDQAMPDNLMGMTLILERVWAATERSRYRLRMVRARNSEQETRDLISGGLRLEPEIGAPAHPLHARAVTALARIGNALDSATFADAAATVLFPPPQVATGELMVRACEDWVLFHRRRTRVCAHEAPAVEPLPERVYRIYRIPAGSAEDVERITEALRLDLASELDAYERTAVTMAAFAPGVQTLRTDRDAIRDHWQIGLRPNAELAFAAIASLGAAYDEGTELALARLSNLLGVLAPVTSVEGAQIEHLSTFPSALGGGAIDGVVALMTVVPAVETVCHDVYVIDDRNWRVLIDPIEGYDLSTLIGQFTRGPLVSGVRFELGTARFVGAGAAMIADAWSETGLGARDIVATLVGVPQLPSANSAEMTELRDQGTAIAAAPNVPSPGDLFVRDGLPADLGPCPRVTILFAPPAQAQVETHAVLAIDYGMRVGDIDGLADQLAEMMADGGWVDEWSADGMADRELGRPRFQGSTPMSGELDPVFDRAQEITLIGPATPSVQQVLVITGVSEARSEADTEAVQRAVAQAQAIFDRLALGVEPRPVMVQRPALPEGLSAITFIYALRPPTVGGLRFGSTVSRAVVLDTAGDDTVVSGAGPLSFDAGGLVIRDAAFEETVRGLEAAGTPIRTIELVRENAPAAPGETDPRAESLLAELRDAGVASDNARVIVRAPTATERTAIAANPALANGALVFRR